nr:MAG TPA: hypothetical protein [Caudoviricetes sp.]
MPKRVGRFNRIVIKLLVLCLNTRFKNVYQPINN